MKPIFVITLSDVVGLILAIPIIIGVIIVIIWDFFNYRKTGKSLFD